MTLGLGTVRLCGRPQRALRDSVGEPRMAAMRFLAFLFLAVASFAAEAPLSLTLQSRSSAGRAVLVKEQWLPSRTAIIVCDMWDLHHCKNAVTREVEMAPRMNEVLEKARAAGVLIIHAPSSCMKPYEGTPARERAKTAPASAAFAGQDWRVVQTNPCRGDGGVSAGSK
jgi:hypothetical protein